ncbi:MAG: hypothetical protein Q8O19_08280 [Rectinemataceae bacterium]|nr:hypothetical protein [Rectinemataceae bacterium]
MALFPFGKKKTRSVALIDIGSASVGGAYAHYEEGKAPIIYYTARVDVEIREGESVMDGMLRSLAFLERLLIEEGAPALRRETGSGVIEKVLVSVAAPWQDTLVTTTNIQQKNAFTFTHAHLADAVKKTAVVPKDRVSSGHTVIATILNGYETPNPFGKRVSRAELVILASTLEKEAAHAIEASLRKAFHTNEIELTAFAPVAYTVFRDLYPHQKDFVVLDVSGTGTDVAFVKRGLLVEVRSVPFGTQDLLIAARKAGQRAHLSAVDMIDPVANESFAKESEEAERIWLDGLHGAFSSVAGVQALPRTLLLLADTDARDYLKRALEKSRLRSLWLSDEPLSVIPVTPSHLAARVKTRGLGDGDLFLALLALYAAKGTGLPEATAPESI